MSHLDLMRCMQRALRRTQLPVSYTQGFNPHTQLSFATALPLGSESVCEIMDVYFDEDISTSELIRKMNDTLPMGVQVLDAQIIPDKAQSPLSILKYAAYTITSEADFSEAVHSFLEQQTCVVSYIGKGKKQRERDIRPYVRELVLLDSRSIHAVLVHTNADVLRAEVLIQGLKLCGFPEEAFCSILRTDLYTESSAGELTDAFDSYQGKRT